MARKALTRGSGMVLGKFLPPTLGHQYLVDFARHYVEDLTVIVGTLEREPIPGSLRFEWVREMFPDANVVHLTDENPQYPHEHPDFWRIWHASIRKSIPIGPDYVFASEDYGFQLAEVLGSRFIPVDPARELVPVRGSDVRDDPMGHWRYIPPCVRPYFVRKVCILGPESTGKSTLAARLAGHLRTVFVHEYARPLIDLLGGHVSPETFPLILRGQAAAEAALSRQANRLLICDTDAFTTALYHELFYGHCPAYIREEAERRSYDLYLLLDGDTPYVADSQRNHPHSREWFLGRCLEWLEGRGARYEKLGGSWEERFRKAISAAETLLNVPGRGPEAKAGSDGGARE